MGDEWFAAIAGAVAGGLFGHEVGQTKGYNKGYTDGYQRARWETDQQLAALRAEFSDQVRQLQAQVNELARGSKDHDERLEGIESTLGRILTILQAEAVARKVQGLG